MVNRTATYLHKHYNRIKKNERPYGCNLEDWEDSLNNVFAKLLERNPDVEAGRESGYVATCLGYEMTNYSYKKRSHADIDIFDVPYVPQSYEMQPIMDVIEKMPQKRREVIEAFLADEKFSEYASRNNVPYDTVKAHFRHGVLDLRKALQGTRIYDYIEAEVFEVVAATSMDKKGDRDTFYNRRKKVKGR